MNNRTKSRSPQFITIAGIIAISVVYAHSALAQTSEDVRAALPTAGQLRGFRDFRVLESHSSYSLNAIRSSDELTVRVYLGTAKDVDAARRAARTATMTQAGPMPAGSLSGRKIGQEVWRSVDYRGGAPRGGFILVTRYGRCLIRVDLMHKITQYENGAPVEPVFSRRDLRMAEDIAIGCVQRLAKMGYGASADKAPGGGKPGSVAKR